MTAEVLEHKIDRGEWTSGPWDDEPDKVQWSHAGFACLAVRNRMGAWCGYVGVPREHPAYGQDYENVDVDVHGGLTYAAKCGGVICHVPEEGFPDDVWWLGFDTAHAMDYLPSHSSEREQEIFREIVDKHRKPNESYEASMPDWFDVRLYKTLGYVQEETNRLADQLATQCALS